MPAEEFYTGVRRAAEGTPYQATQTTEGFDVTLDIVDAEWFGIFNKAGLNKVYTHHVKLLDDGAFSVTDESRTVEWVAGTPRVAASAELQKGRIKEFGVEKVWAFDAQGNFGVQADYRFNSEEGRQLIEGVAEQLALKQRRGTEEKIGLIVGLGTLVLLALSGIVLLVLWLAGAF